MIACDKCKAPEARTWAIQVWCQPLGVGPLKAPPTPGEHVILWDLCATCKQSILDELGRIVYSPQWNKNRTEVVK